MKILFIAHDSLKGGSGRCLFELVSLLAQRTEITPIVLTHKKNDINEALDDLGIENYSSKYGFTCSWTENIFFTFLKRLLYRPFFNWYSFRKLKKKIDFNTIDLIQSNSGVIDFGAYLHKKLHIPHVWHIREFGGLHFKWRYVIDNFPSYLYANASQVICVSNAVRDYYIEQGIKEHKIKTIYDGVLKRDYIFSTPIEHDKNIIRICMCGILTDSKGQHLAIEALKKLKRDELKKIHLDFFGEGPDLQKLKDLVKHLDLVPYVSFKGFSKNIKSELLNYDIGLNLTRAEGFGRTTVEFMLSGLYVIAHNTGASPELLNYGKYGTLIPPNDTDQLSKEISNYIANPSKYKQLQKDARSFALSNFTLESNIDKFIAQFSSISKEKK